MPPSPYSTPACGRTLPRIWGLRQPYIITIWEGMRSMRIQTRKSLLTSYPPSGVEVFEREEAAGIVANRRCDSEKSGGLIAHLAMQSRRAPDPARAPDIPRSGWIARWQRDNRPRLAACGLVWHRDRRAPVEIAGSPGTFQRVGRGR